MTNFELPGGSSFKPVLESANDSLGFLEQCHIAIEEMAELTKEICKTIRSAGYVAEGMYEEIADVMIMLHQLIVCTNSETEVNNHMVYKINRLVERLGIEQ